MYRVLSRYYQYNTHDYFELNQDETIKINKRIDTKLFDNCLNQSTNYSITWPLRIYNTNNNNEVAINNRVIYSKRELQDPIAYICYIDNTISEPRNEELETKIKELLQYEYHLKVSTVKSINLYTVIELLIKNEISDFGLVIRNNFNAAGFTIYLILGNKNSKINIIEQIVFKLANIVNIKTSIMKLVPLINNINDYHNIYRDKVLNLFYKLGFVHKSQQTIVLNTTDINNLQKIATIDVDDFIEFYKSKDWTNEIEQFKDILATPIAKNRKDLNFTKTINVKGIQIRINDCVTISSLGLLTKIFKNITYSDVILLTYLVFQYYNKYDSLLSAISVAKIKSLTSIS